jgi:hypothetical protein
MLNLGTFLWNRVDGAISYFAAAETAYVQVSRMLLLCRSSLCGSGCSNMKIHSSSVGMLLSVIYLSFMD